LKTIRYTGSTGDLTPWVRKIVKNFSINWAWSEEGRKRLLKPISRLSRREQRIFELYFWRGLSPSAIHEQLGLEGKRDISITDVLDALERIFSLLSQKKLWRLLSNLSRMRGTVSLDEINEETGAAFEPTDTRANPEQALIRSESDERLSAALDALLPAERLSIQLRYEDGLSIKEIAEMLNLSEKEVKSLLKSAMARLRQDYK
jgi:RNA polymerase sigma factor (sigma-70 family)